MSLSLGLIAVPAPNAEDVAGRLSGMLQGDGLHFQHAADSSTQGPSVGAQLGGWVLVTDPQRVILRSRATLAHLSRNGRAYTLDADESARAATVAAWSGGALEWQLARTASEPEPAAEKAIPQDYVYAWSDLGAEIAKHPDATYLILVQLFTRLTGFRPDQPGWWEQVPYRSLVNRPSPTR